MRYLIIASLALAVTLIACTDPDTDTISQQLVPGDAPTTEAAAPTVVAAAPTEPAADPPTPVPPPPTNTPVPPPPPPPTEPPPAASNCHPSYPTLCLPGAPDIDCGEISARNFPVRPPDPHGFDRDNDGVGCEG